MEENRAAITLPLTLHLPPGHYHVRATAANGQTYGKLILARAAE